MRYLPGLDFLRIDKSKSPSGKEDKLPLYTAQYPAGHTSVRKGLKAQFIQY